MEKIVNELLKEELYYEKLENGLDVYFMPKRGFTKKYAVLATNYGSNDLEFIPIGETEPIRVNEGIAHFLEHKMFEQPDESDAFEKFSKWGANANAFTNFTTTAYLFTTTENFYDCLDQLFYYVQTPHFTDENVEIEKGIICKNYNECKFGIRKNDKFLEYYKKKPNKTMVKSILKNGSAKVKSLTSKQGNKFDATLRYSKKNNGYFSWDLKI